MNLLVASSIFVSSFAWALFDTSRKKLSSRIEAAPIVFWLTVLQAPMFFVFGFFESWKCSRSSS
ncbi:MAG: hypothetical protein V4692_10080 [Bdellovibrionota bacterium]